MTATFLFRIDGARDNDAFFNALRPSMSHVYAGVDIQIGSSGWSPDFIKLSVRDANDFTLTLIELDAIESIVRISCRKYLPENSTDIVRAFSKYLDRVIAQCKSTAHPHEDEFVRLKTMLSKADSVVVTTAGALRSSIIFTEELSLLDQPERIVHMQSPETTEQMTSRRLPPTFDDKILRLSALETKILSSTVLVLDAIIRQEDHSVAGFRAWRANTLKNRLQFKHLRGDVTHPILHGLLFETVNRGMVLNFETLLSELAKMWSDATKSNFDAERTRNLISGYYPIASEIKREEESMRFIFETARNFVATPSSTQPKS
jgi:hypothetical protein